MIPITKQELEGLKKSKPFRLHDNGDGTYIIEDTSFTKKYPLSEEEIQKHIQMGYSESEARDWASWSKIRHFRVVE